MKLICPLLKPALVVSSRTVNVSEPPAAIDDDKPSTRVNPVGRLGAEVVSVALPSLRTVKVWVTPAPPRVVVPKSLPSVVLGVVSPSRMVTPFPSTVISGT